LPNKPRLTVELGAETSGFQKGMATAKWELYALGFAMERVGRQIGQAGTVVTNFGTQVFGALGKAAQAAIDFEEQMRYVDSIAKYTNEEFISMSKEVLDLSSQWGKSSADIAKGLYFIESSGFRAAEAMGVLSVATKLAVAGMTDVEAAASTLVAILNAYGMTAKDAAKAADILWIGVDKGIFEFKDLEGELGKLLVTAGTLTHTSLQEIIAAMIVMTREGFDVAMAVTGITRLLQSYVHHTADAAKVAKSLNLEYDATSITAKGLKGVIQDLIDTFHLNKVTLDDTVLAGNNYNTMIGMIAAKTGIASEKLAELFPEVRALQTAIGLVAQGGKPFAQALEYTANSAGSVASAVQRISQSTAFSIKVLQTNFQRLAIEVGTTFLPTIKKVVTWLTELVKKFNNLSDNAKVWIGRLTVLGGAFTVLIGVLLKVGGAVLGFVGSLVMLSAITIPLRARLGGEVGVLTMIEQALGLVTVETNALTMAQLEEIGVTVEQTAGINNLSRALLGLGSASTVTQTGIGSFVIGATKTMGIIGILIAITAALAMGMKAASGKAYEWAASMGEAGERGRAFAISLGDVSKAIVPAIGPIWMLISQTKRLQTAWRIAKKEGKSFADATRMAQTHTIEELKKMEDEIGKISYDALLKEVEKYTAGNTELANVLQELTSEYEYGEIAEKDYQTALQYLSDTNGTYRGDLYELLILMKEGKTDVADLTNEIDKQAIYEHRVAKAIDAHYAANQNLNISEKEVRDIMAETGASYDTVISQIDKMAGQYTGAKQAIEDVTAAWDAQKQAILDVQEAMWGLASGESDLLGAYWDLKDANEAYYNALKESTDPSTAKHIEELNKLITEEGKKYPEVQKAIAATNAAHNKYHDDLVVFNSTNKDAIKLLGEHAEYLTADGKETEKSQEAANAYNELVKKSIPSYKTWQGAIANVSQAIHDAGIESPITQAEFVKLWDVQSELLLKDEAVARAWIDQNRSLMNMTGTIGDVITKYAEMSDADKLVYKDMFLTNGEFREFVINAGEAAVKAKRLDPEGWKTWLTLIGMSKDEIKALITPMDEVQKAQDELAKGVESEVTVTADTEPAKKEIGTIPDYLKKQEPVKVPAQLDFVTGLPDITELMKPKTITQGTVVAQAEQQQKDVNKIWEDVKKGFEQFSKDSETYIEGATKKVTTWFGTMVSTTEGSMRTMFNNANKWFSNIYYSISTWVSAMGIRVWSGFNYFAGYASNAMVRMYNAIQGGFWNIYKMIGTWTNLLYMKFVILGERIVEAFKLGMQIGSPSFIERAMMAISESTLSAVNVVENAVQRLSTPMVNVSNVAATSPTAGTVVENIFKIDKVIIREEADVGKVAKELYYLQAASLRGVGK